MKKYMFVLVGALIVVLALSGCVANPNQPIRDLAATGNGKVYIAPDVAYINIGVHTEADSVADAINANSRQAEKVAAALEKLGIESKDVQTTAFNVYPQQEYSPEGTVIRRYYSVDNTVYVTVRNLADLSKVLDEVVRAGANNINGISFDILDREGAQSEARDLAIANARQEAEEIAAASGVNLGEIQSVSVYSNVSPVPVYEGKGGGAVYERAAEVPVSAGQLVISIDATIVYEIK